MAEHPELEDGSRDQHEHDGVAHLWESDVLELPERTSTVELGGLIEALGDALSARQQDCEIEAGLPPDGHQGQCGHRERFLAEDVAHEPADVMGESAVCRVQLQPEEPDDRDGHDVRDKVEELQHLRTLHAAVDPQRHREADEQQQRDRQHDEPGGVLERLPEHRVLKQSRVVLEADELRLRRVQKVPLEEAHVQSFQ